MTLTIPGAAMSSVEPIVSGLPTKYAGRYRLGGLPKDLLPHNASSWQIIKTILDVRGTADFWDMAVAVRGHESGTKSDPGPQGFIRYCIRRGWLARA